MVKTGCPKEIPYPCTPFWIFQVLPSTFKNHNLVCGTPNDVILFVMETLGCLLSYPKI